ncbi:MAG: hypothetical protein EOP04_31230 [Proteobacteria bacterium]|nr:MAG: hypothetical protein EOP04_31230 [Pseudomonadota bacterium]
MKNFVIPALLALATLTTAAHADEAQYGQEMISASNEIRGIVALAGTPPNEGNDSSSTGTSESGWGFGGESSGSTGGSSSGWSLQNDFKAIPFYNSSSELLYKAGTSMLRASALKNNGQQTEAYVTRTDACVQVRAALANLASANFLAGEPGSTQVIKPFSDRLKVLFDSIEANRPVYCTF